MKKSRRYSTGRLEPLLGRMKPNSSGCWHRRSGAKQKCLQPHVTLHVRAARQMLLGQSRRCYRRAPLQQPLEPLPQQPASTFKAQGVRLCSSCAHNAACVPAQTHQVSPPIAARRRAALGGFLAELGLSWTTSRDTERASYLLSPRLRRAGSAVLLGSRGPPPRTCGTLRAK